jgi:hypothetical protein
MELTEILDAIRNRYPDQDICFLVDRLAAGELHFRKQLADKISLLPARLTPSMHLAISKWAIDDDLSHCREIREV